MKKKTLIYKTLTKIHTDMTAVTIESKAIILNKVC